jgi:serine/threonine protein kinase
MSFVERLSASRLLSAEELAAVRLAVGDEEEELVQYLLGQNLLTRFQVRQLRAGAVSFHVGKYVVVDCLGRGGNGIVFKARHLLMPDRYVALKTVDTRNLHYTEEVVTRFRREIDIVARLEHPNVVRALDVLQTRTHLYLVLEYIPGRDLGSLVRERGPLPVGEAVNYALQAARGLAYAHGRGIVHRDLKPANLLLTEDAVVKLSDLGLARFFTQQPESDLTIKGLALGTPDFMAPEQAEDAARADARSDLYSLGATLFHLLTAELPVGGSSYLHCLKRLLTMEIRSVAQARPDVPPALAVVVDRLRARDPADRPPNAAVAIALLEPFARRTTTIQGTIWDSKRKAALVLEVIRGKSSAEQACQKHGIEIAEFENWRSRFLRGAEEALEPGSDAARGDARLIRELHAKIGAQAMEIEALKRRLLEEKS